MSSIPSGRSAEYFTPHSTSGHEPKFWQLNNDAVLDWAIERSHNLRRVRTSHAAGLIVPSTRNSQASARLCRHRATFGICRLIAF